MGTSIRFAMILAVTLSMLAAGEERAVSGFPCRLQLVLPILLDASVPSESHDPCRIRYSAWWELGLARGTGSIPTLRARDEDPATSSYTSLSSLAPPRLELDKARDLTLSLDQTLVFDADLPYAPLDPIYLEQITPRGLRTPEIGGVRGYLELRVVGVKGVSAGISIDF